ncbi:MAG: HD domain-containing protein [Acidobacteria bacterium]|nr:HD domain-containing protein [Acidobacteriota bacterium]
MITTIGSRFFEASLDLLAADPVLPCEIWIRHGTGGPMLYRARDVPFCSNQLERLRACGIDTVLVPREDESAWASFVEQHLWTWVQDSTLPAARRVRVLFGATEAILKSVLPAPDAPGMAGRIADLADAAAVVLAGPDAALEAIQPRDYADELPAHSAQVAVLAAAIAALAGVGPDTLASIVRGGLVHDCGRRQELARGAGFAQASRDWQRMRAHPARGAELLEQAGWKDRIALEICRSHHERLDGSGYPRGIGAEAISDEVRVVAIADTFATLTARRDERANARRPGEALAAVAGSAARGFDPRFAQPFARAVLLRGR